MLANHISNKGLLSRIYKVLSNLNSKKSSNPIRKWAKDMSKYFTEKDIQIANKHMNICSITLAHENMFNIIL